MSKLIAFFLFFIAGIGVLYAIYNNAQAVSKKIVDKKNIQEIATSSQIIHQKGIQKYLFVPYWAFEKEIVIDSKYSLIYFGLGVNNNGIDRSDKGFEKLEKFVQLTPKAKERVLAIRMVDATINSKVLKDQKLEEKIAREAVSIAKMNKFNAVLLDFETSAFAFDSTISNISDFYTLMSQITRDSGLKFYVTLFGDNFFRTRAYDVEKIGKLADKVMIMTYDFHKSRGNPGPNFPLFDDGNYGYDLGKMVTDFQKDVDNEKLIIVLGFFGYDWRLGKDGKAISSGIPLSTNEIQKEFIENCKYKNCSLVTDKESKEPSIVYVDDANNNHVVWFEDEVSVNKKIEYLKTRGILEIAHWAYSYY